MYYNLLIFILINSGLAIGVCRSKFTEPFREKVKLKHPRVGAMLKCCQCFGFWSSILVYVYVYHTLDLNTVGFTFIGSFTAHLFNRISNIITIS